MTMMHMPNALFRPHNYYKIREFCYFMLANQIRQQEVERARDVLDLAKERGTGDSFFGPGVNFTNVHDFFKRGARPTSGMLEPAAHHDGDVNESQATEKQVPGQLIPPFNSTIITHSSALQTAQQQTRDPKPGHGTPRQFQNIDSIVEKPIGLQR
jgi:hypothetical protein